MSHETRSADESADAPDWSDALERAAAHIERAERLLITSHRRPDGDAIGSMIALASLLREQGKVAVLYNRDQVPRRYKWLPLTGGFRSKLGSQATYEATLIVDCAEARLLGEGFPDRSVTGERIVLDHHSTAVPFGDIYVCDPRASSVGVLVARLARVLGWSLNPDAALGIYYSMASDTGSFRFANTTAEAMRLAADMMDLGVDAWQVNEHLHESVSPAHYRLLGAVVDGVEMAHDDKVAFFTLTPQLLQTARATWEDSVELVNYARTLSGIECGVLLSPLRDGRIRVSVRSKGHVVDAGELCGRMGGGGHRGAAGAVLTGTLSDVRERVFHELGAALAAPPDHPGQDGQRDRPEKGIHDGESEQHPS